MPLFTGGQLVLMSLAGTMYSDDGSGLAAIAVPSPSASGSFPAREVQAPTQPPRLKRWRSC